MKKSLKQVRPEDFDVKALMVAAREGRLYVNEQEENGHGAFALGQRETDMLIMIGRHFLKAMAELNEKLQKGTDGLADFMEFQGDAADLSDDERIVRAIGILNTEGLIKHKYDYTWVMQVMNETDGMPSYDSPQSFLTHITELQEKTNLILKIGLPDISNMNKELGKMTGKFPNWTFIGKDKTETNRRINIAKRYCNAFRKGE